MRLQRNRYCYRLTVQCEQEFEVGLNLLRRTKTLCPISRSINVLQVLEARVETSKLFPAVWKKKMRQPSRWFESLATKGGA